MKRALVCRAGGSIGMHLVKKLRGLGYWVRGGIFDDVYQLAADMGGMGFIRSAETEIMHHSALINIYMTD